MNTYSYITSLTCARAIKRVFTLPCLLIFLLGLSACAAKDYPALETADYVDPERFVGRWYVIANIPYFAERNKVGSQTIYQKREGKGYDDIFVARNKNFDNPEKRLKGSVVSLNDSNTSWKSTFYRFLNFTFHVVYIEDDYRYMLLGHPSRNYGWVMARTNVLDEADYQKAMSVFSDRGYEIGDFLKVPQIPEQLGQSGFQ